MDEPQHDHSGGREWQQPDHARAFFERMTRPDQDRSEQFRLLVALLPFEREAPLRILDLGAGYGALTEALLEAFPAATALGADFSEEMMKLGRERLARYGDRFAYLAWDLNEPDWPEAAAGPFDLVVSSLAIHHLTDDRKRGLFRQIRDHLRPGGWFVNIDLVRPPSAEAGEAVARAAKALSTAGDAGERRWGDHSPLATLADQLRFAEEAGLAGVDCFWKRLFMAMYGGYRS